MPPIDDLTGWIFKVVIAGVSAFLWWGKKEDKKLLDAHTVDIVALKTSAVTEQQVRSIITEVTLATIAPVLETINDIKRVVTENRDGNKRLELKLATQEGYDRAKQEMS